MALVTDPVSRVSDAMAGGGADLAEAIASRGFVLLDAPVAREWLCGGLPQAQLTAFADSWNHLPLDEYMADGGRYRRRRHAVYVAESGVLLRQPNQPHYQSLAHNPLNGGIARWFGEMAADIADGPLLRSAIGTLVSVSDRLRGSPGRWRVEAHQFRIEARAGEAGQPTPEGMHRDGVDLVLVMLIARQNAAHGTTTIADAAGAPLVRVQLSHPLEAMILDDTRTRHGVSPIEPVDRARPAIRDALVVTLAAQPSAEPAAMSAPVQPQPGASPG
jgi:hypothetical protein